jgi:hypothetical protein
MREHEEDDDDDSSEIAAGLQPLLPDGWVSIGPNLVLRVDGMRLTTPDPALWDLHLLGDCPFVVEMQRETERGPERVQRPLLRCRLVEACEEADKRFPVPSWLLETATGPAKRLGADAKDEGWFGLPRQRGAVVVEGIELEEPDAAVGYGYIAGSKPWSPSAFRVEKDRAAQRRARWKRIIAEARR